MAVDFDKNLIPEPLREKPYMKEIDSFDKLFTAFDGAQTLLGKRPAGIPQDNAPEEEVVSFYSTLKPKDVKEYEIPETEFSKKVGRTDEAKNLIRGLLHKADISKHQAKKLIPELDGVLAKFSSESEAAKQAAEAAEDKKYDDQLNALYGDKRPAVIERATKFLSEILPDNQKPLIKNMSTDTLLLMTTLSEKIHEKYIKDDKLPGGGSGGAGGETVEGLNAEAQKIMMTPAYKDFRDPGYAAARAKVADLSTRAAKLSVTPKQG